MTFSRHDKRFVAASLATGSASAATESPTRIPSAPSASFFPSPQNVGSGPSTTEPGASVPRRAPPPPHALVIPSAAQKQKLSHDCRKLYRCDSPSPSKRAKLVKAGSGSGAELKHDEAFHPFFAYETAPIGLSRPITTIPLEILHRILRLATTSASGRANGEHLDMNSNKKERKAICAAMRVCKLFRSVACPFLYQSVVLDGRNSQMCRRQWDRILESKTSRITNAWQADVTTDDIIIQWRGRLQGPVECSSLERLDCFTRPHTLKLKLNHLAANKPLQIPKFWEANYNQLRVLYFHLNGSLVLSDIPPEKPLKMNLVVLFFSALAKMQATPNFIAALRCSADSLADLTFEYDNTRHSDCEAWKTLIPTLTALKTVTFPCEVLTPLLAVLAQSTTLECVKVRNLKQVELFEGIGMDLNKIQLI